MLMLLLTACVSPCASPVPPKGGIFPRELPCTTPPCICPAPPYKRVFPSSHLPLSPLHAFPLSRLTPLLSSQGLFGFTIVNNATNCDSGSTWSSTGLTPCTACSTCMESGVTRLCDRSTDAVCSTTVPQRSAATVTLTLVADGSVSAYNEQSRTNLQLKFALAAGVRAASTLSFRTPPLTS